MMKNTMTDMVKELDKLSGTAYVETLKKKAADGEFHDYRSKAVCGKHYAVECIDHALKYDNHLPPGDLKALAQIRNDIIAGEYDEPFTKEDEAFCHAEADNDPDMSEKDRVFFKSMMRAR
jgi:hypothetical protein